MAVPRGLGRTEARRVVLRSGAISAGAGLLCAILVAGTSTASAELGALAIPDPAEGRTWLSVEQSPLVESRHVVLFDSERFEDGIGSREAVILVDVPDVDLHLAEDEYGADDPDSLSRFSRHVAQRDVVALQDVEVDGETAVSAGDVLIPRWTSLPREFGQVQLLRRAGVEQIPTLLNVAEMYPRPPDADKFNKALNLTPLAQFESRLRVDDLEKQLAWLFDGDPMTHFPRVDETGVDVKQKFILYMDLARYYPLRLLRVYPSPLVPFPLAAYTVYLGEPGTERTIAGLNLDDIRVGNFGFPKFVKVANTFPTFVEAQSVPVNTEDTIQVVMDPPRLARYVRMDMESGLDYDLAEIEMLGDGFVPLAVYTTRPLPIPKATLGRITWEEEVIGDPSASRIIVRAQTGFNQEPLVLFRLNDFEDPVEWKTGEVLVTDHRLGTQTHGQLVDLNAVDFNLASRAVFSALSDSERAVVRTTREEFKAIAPGKRARTEPDLVFWSGFQSAANGQPVIAASGRPYIQLQVEFQSDNPKAACFVRNLRVEYSSPQIIDEVFGEIAPVEAVVAGRDTTFTLALMAKLAGASSGFNRVQVFTPARIASLEEVALQVGSGPVVSLQEAIGQVPGPGQFTQELVEDRQFVLGFQDLAPGTGGGTTEVKLGVRFRGRVIDFRTTYRVNAFHDTLGVEPVRVYEPNGLLRALSTTTGDTLALFLPQPVGPGDVRDFAAELLTDGNALVVTADVRSQGNDLITNVRVGPNPFSPNGDGVNDRLVIDYDVQRLLLARPIALGIYDLSGRPVRGIEEDLTSGGYSYAWDGLDENGQPVPPGLYLLRISADADDPGADAVRTIAVAY